MGGVIGDARQRPVQPGGRSPAQLVAGGPPIAEAQVAIVGAGPAGITLALRLARQGVAVLLLEAGGRRAGRVVAGGTLEGGYSHPPGGDFRRTGLGGSSAIWGGRLAPLDPIDLAPRPKLKMAGWPIPYAALAAYYPEALEICGGGAVGEGEAEEAAGWDVEAKAGAKVGAKVGAKAGARVEAKLGEEGEAGWRGPWQVAVPPILDLAAGGALHQDSLERFSEPRHFGRHFGPELAASDRIEVLLHAPVSGIVLEEGGRAVRGLTLRLPGGGAWVRARHYVLAMGGLETPRLLLACREVHAMGIGNEWDQLGRYYMSHLAAIAGRFRPNPGVRPAHGYWRDAQGVYCRRRLALSLAAQARGRAGNVIARLHHLPPDNPAHGDGLLSALVLGRRLIGAEYGSRLGGSGSGRVVAHLGNVLLHPGSTLFRLGHLAVRRGLMARKLPSIVTPMGRRGFAFDIHCEQFPNPLSRVRLGGAMEADGLPELRIAWAPGADDRRTLNALATALSESLSPFGTVDAAPKEIAKTVLSAGAYGGHFLGTARMGEDARAAVVDADLLVHGMVNLHLCGGAVFPSSGQANPTLSIVALALRLGDHLAGVLRAEARPGQIGHAALQRDPATTGW